MSNDVVITGIGCCSALGVLPDALLQTLGQGDGVRGVVHPVKIPSELGGGEDGQMMAIPELEPSSVSGLRRPYPDRPTLMALLATDQAITAAGIDTSREDGTAIGLVLNTCFGPSQTVERYLRTLLAQGPALVSAISFARAVSNALGGEVSRRHHLRGPSTTLLGSSAIAYGADLLANGCAEAVVCAGVDEVRAIHLWAYREAGLLAEGLTLGEGAAAVVLERRDVAEARGARIWARIASYAMGFCPESVQRITDVTEESLAQCMERALRRSPGGAANVECVVSIDNGDARMANAERAAVRRVLARAPKWLAPRRALGETFGASEIMGALASIGALRESGTTSCLVNTCQPGGAISSVLMEAT